MPEPNTVFSSDYITAKKRFTELANAHNGELTSLSLDAVDLQNQPLSIDIAWFGAQSPRSVILHSSGLHGVEGFAGSAIQLQLLHRLPSLPGSVALVFVHLLNPYGMAWLRRCNENNVDLNRNYLGENEPYRGSPQAYATVNALINPQSPPSADFFYTQAVLNILRHGYGTLKQAIAGGQYDYPKGLFYGGDSLQQGLSLYQRWLTENLPDVDNVLAIDVHTGLGKWGHDALFVDSKMGVLAPIFYEKVHVDRVSHNYSESVAYKIKGGLSALVAHCFPNANVDLILQEFGSYSPVKVLHALRQENRCHFYSQPNAVFHPVLHPAKRRIKEIFCPQKDEWRSSVLDRGVSLVESAINHLRY